MILLRQFTAWDTVSIAISNAATGILNGFAHIEEFVKCQQE